MTSKKEAQPFTQARTSRALQGGAKGSTWRLPVSITTKTAHAKHTAVARVRNLVMAMGIINISFTSS